MKAFNYSSAPTDTYSAGSAPPATAIVYATGTVGGIVTVANSLLAVIIVVALARNEFSALAAIIVGGVYYGVTTLAALFILSGSLTAIVTSHQEQITLRQYHRLQYRAQNLDIVHPLQLPNSQDTDPVRPQTPPTGLPLTHAYVAPSAPSSDFDEAARREAIAWVIQLYGTDGEPDPKKVLLETDKERPGRIRITAPSREAKRFLLERSIIHDLGNGYRLSLVKCPTISAAQDHLR